jgi:hypothetical protein
MEKNFMSEEDKLVLRKVAKYLKSYNVSSGIIQIENDFYRNPENAIRHATNFSNNWSIEIPDFFKPYLGEIIEKITSNIDDLDVDSVNYDNVEIEIIADSSMLEITRYWGYEQPGDTNGLTWGYDEDSDAEEVKRLMDEIKESGARPDSNGILELEYNGSGDSGYLESSFRNGDRVPSNIENWCYEVLERNHGGWEINEGSQGYFVFDTKNNIIELEHTYNELVEETEDILSVYFGKSKD